MDIVDSLTQTALIDPLDQTPRIEWRNFFHTPDLRELPRAQADMQEVRA